MPHYTIVAHLIKREGAHSPVGFRRQSPARKSDGRARECRKEAQEASSQVGHASVWPMNDQPAQLADASRAPLDPMFPRLIKEADTPVLKLIGFIAYGLYEEA